MRRITFKLENLGTHYKIKENITFDKVSDDFIEDKLNEWVQDNIMSFYEILDYDENVKKLRYTYENAYEDDIFSENVEVDGDYTDEDIQNDFNEWLDNLLDAWWEEDD